MTFRKSAIAALSLPVFAAVLLGGCRHTGDLDETGGITAVRTACPSVAVPAGTGDITLFDPATSHDATALAVPGTTIQLAQRGKVHQATVTTMPFIPHRYVRAGGK